MYPIVEIFLVRPGTTLIHTRKCRTSQIFIDRMAGSTIRREKGLTILGVHINNSEKKKERYKRK